MARREITIKNTDCIEGLRKLEDHTVDLAFADPPFNIGYAYDVYDDRQDDEQYLTWCREWLSEIRRVLKPDGIVLEILSPLPLAGEVAVSAAGEGNDTKPAPGSYGVDFLFYSLNETV